MRSRTSLVVLSVLLILFSSPSVMTAQAHTASTFTVLVQENGFSQQSPVIIQNDSIIWHNTDNSSNLSHRLVYDHDGDGFYNGTFDWDSGELFADCETDENNTQIDSNCSTSFFVEFDTNWTVGNYSYQDIRSDGSIVNATIVLQADVGEHEEPYAPPIGSTFGLVEDENEAAGDEESSLEPEQLLLYVAGFTGGTSLILIAILMMRTSSKNAPNEEE
ncbi:MAG: Uncharacterised protein [Marine Group II euryarchaeote MED-G33]|nr:MAG: Uncharacterised protein [Marine Group II euryarchaeote MED-G33]